MAKLYETLVQYGNGEVYPFHMPGHKRNTKLMDMVNPYSIDITEIDGFDDMHCPEGIIKEAMEHTAKLYGAKKTFFCVNGSTGGILAGISACSRHKGKILLARNCHKSVYNAVLLNELKPIYIYPQLVENWGVNSQISPQNVEELLITNPDVWIVVITSPTYEGIVSDIEGIAEVTHRYGIPLLVDEAHGAHFGFHPAFPKSSIELGADIVIQSVHKTLPCFTQTALVQVNSDLIDMERLSQYVSIYQTTSPSYLFMAGIDRCMNLLEQNCTELFDCYVKRLDWFYDRCRNLKHIELLQADRKEKDYGKLVISVKNTDMTGPMLYDILLENYKLQMEMVSDHYVIAMTSIADTEEGFERLWLALEEIDSTLLKQTNQNFFPKLEQPEVILTPYEAGERQGEIILFSDSAGRISKEYAYLYPPGIPILVPGEKIEKKTIERIFNYKKNGLQIKGLRDSKTQQIEVVKEED